MNISKKLLYTYSLILNLYSGLQYSFAQSDIFFVEHDYLENEIHIFNKGNDDLSNNVSEYKSLELPSELYLKPVSAVDYKNGYDLSVSFNDNQSSTVVSLATSLLAAYLITGKPVECVISAPVSSASGVEVQGATCTYTTVGSTISLSMTTGTGHSSAINFGNGGDDPYENTYHTYSFFCPRCNGQLCRMRETEGFIQGYRQGYDQGYNHGYNQGCLASVQNGQSMEQITTSSPNQETPLPMLHSIVGGREILRIFYSTEDKYPNKQQKAELVRRSGLTMTQVATFFSNARRRDKKNPHSQ